MIKHIFFSILLVMLTACSSSSNFPIPGTMSSPDLQMDTLYLRGVFNWWEATPAFKFKEGSTGWYVDVELIADGQPYDFRISNQSWTPGQTCGAKYPGQSVTADTRVYMVCNPGEQNLQFTPNSTGIYRFRLSPASGDELALIISKKR